MNDDPWGSWLAFGQAARSYFEAFSTGGPVPAARQFSDFLRDQFAAATPWRMQPDAFGQAGTAQPAVGPTREHQARAQRLMEAWRRMEAAQRRLQQLWQDVLQEAAAAFVGGIASPAEAFSSPDALRALYERWISCAETAYGRTAHSEAFCQAQSELVNAGSEWRREQQANIEHWMKHLDLPTRSEVSSLIRQVQDLERQVRTLQQRAAESQPAQKTTPVRKAPTTRKVPPARKTPLKSRRRRPPVR